MYGICLTVHPGVTLRGLEDVKIQLQTKCLDIPMDYSTWLLLSQSEAEKKESENERGKKS